MSFHELCLLPVIILGSVSMRFLCGKLIGVSLRKMCKEWIRDPMNMALFAWIVCVAVSGAILFLVMTGMLNHELPKKSQRDAWFEVNNQILNALFTLMCLYQHPKRFYHLVLLCRWRPEDISKLRKIYCKNGTYKPHEWAHMMVVVILLHINCFAQYALCGLNLGPLGKEYDSETDEEAQVPITTDSNRSSQLRRKSMERRFSFASRDEQRVVESRPEWSGGVLDFWDDISLAYLSLFCTVNIDNDTARAALGTMGLILCVFGLLYGGFWRIQMRKRFNLPAYHFCCGEPAVTDCALWLCCCWCSLSQEVRTGNSYDIVENTFCRKKMDGGSQLPISPLPREDGVSQIRSGSSSPLGNSASPLKIIAASPSSSRASKGYYSPERNLPVVEEESPAGGKDEIMIPPVPSLIRREAN
ncbi:hypothetical protein CK203_070872 [Vitis vinifera]|uniref:PLAC8 family protein n=1 Tax=Vitis vinifera TaxID=29760 RepID=A0A438E3L1_VITVI|nr:hypothetical protein CK203_070872 [Vitis vinifera]